MWATASFSGNVLLHEDNDILFDVTKTAQLEQLFEAHRSGEYLSSALNLTF
jgi:hypothetical protein